MKNTKSQRAGFWGTFVFHTVLIVICVIFSLGYMPLIEKPKGEELRHKFKFSTNAGLQEKIDKKNQDAEVKAIHSNQDNLAEDIVEQKKESLGLNSNQDTLMLVQSKDEKELEVLSPELMGALASLDNLPTLKDSMTADDPDPVPDIDPSSYDDPSGGSYILNNRYAINKPKPKYNCKEMGIVVVLVTVNREGETIKAEAGIRGTTESAPCLIKEAEEAALNTTWRKVGPNAREFQVGQITYNFYQN